MTRADPAAKLGLAMRPRILELLAPRLRPGHLGIGVLLLAAACGDAVSGAGEGSTSDAGDTTDAGDSTESGPPTTSSGDECQSPADCQPEHPECRAVVGCAAGRCEHADVPAGEPAATQTPGDCAAAVCDGAGGLAVEADETDVVDDGIACTVDACDGTTPTHEPGPACVCTPGASEPCYTGEAGTQDVGVCVAGTQVCAADGESFGACEGEVVPTLEDCDGGAVDEDCDGEVDESGPRCVCGDGVVSAGEVCDDGDTIDDDCSADCSAERRVVQVTNNFFQHCALLADGRIKCWGSNMAGTLGIEAAGDRGDQPGELGAELPFVDLGAGTTPVAITGNRGLTCAIMMDGRIKCWGFNAVGVLGLGVKGDVGLGPDDMGDDLPYVDLGANVVVKQVALGNPSCALIEGGVVKCWGGDNLHGGLGLGEVASEPIGDDPDEMGAATPTIDVGGPVKVVRSGDGTVCALLEDGAVKCWGSNGNGQLGLGDLEDRGDEADEMGDDLPPVALALAPDESVVDLSVTANFVCVVTSDGRVKCWGHNTYGQLGLGHTDDIGDEPGEMGDALPFVDLGAGHIAFTVASINNTTCALLEDHQLRCWGAAPGLGDDEHIGDEPGEMGDALQALDLGAGLTVESLADGANDTGLCAVLSNGRIKCWGLGLYGNLGRGDSEDVGYKPGEMGDMLPFIELLSADW